MSKLNLFFVFAIAFAPITFTGCGGGTETSVVEEDTSAQMTEAEEEEYEAQMTDAGGDESQN